MVKEAYFFNDKRLLPQFIWEYVTYYFLYGYLCLAVTTVLIFFLIFLLKAIPGWIKYSSLFLLVPIGYAFIRFVLILASTHYKWRFYRITNYRLQTRGFNEAHFKYEMYEPCMRLVTRRTLYKYGYQDKYKEMLGKYIKVNQRVEDAKNRLLESVIHGDETKSNMKEEGYGKNLQS
jgi:glucan phosphoethanolaminetransferase (alkaline phosphatase superfamily)